MNKRLLQLIVLLSLLILCYFLYTTQSRPPNTIANISDSEIYCFREKQVGTLPDISTLAINRSQRLIFFHETSCNSFKNGKIVINTRQACSVESALFWNPNSVVHLTFSAPAEDDHDDLLQALSSYPNLRLSHLDYEKYVRDTPLEKVYSSGALEKSEFSVSHSSDLLRFLTLFKYGGIYLDLDMITLRNLDDLNFNFVSFESEEIIGSAVLSFSASEPGHTYAATCVEDIGSDYRGDVWGHNGPGAVSRLTTNLCGGKLRRGTCGNLTVLSQESFFPIPYWEWGKYFSGDDSEKVLEKLNGSYGIHAWNKLSAGAKAEGAFLKVAEKNCPKVFQVSEGAF